MTGWNRALAVLLLGACVVAPRPADAGPKTVRPNEALAAPLQLRIRQAIEKGVAFLRAQPLRWTPSEANPRTQQFYEACCFEEAALVTWVLRRVGLAPEHADLAPALARLRERAPRTAQEASFLLLALTAQPLGDGDLGGAAETEAPADATSADTVRAEDRPLAESALKQLLAMQAKTDSALFDGSGGWRGGYPPAMMVDILGTYVALMALESCVRAGLPVPNQPVLEALALLLRWQAPTGPSTTLRLNEVRGAERTEWSVSARIRGFDSMGVAEEPAGHYTAGAAVGLTICHDLLQEEPAYTAALRQKTQSAILDALAWIQSNYTITKCPSKTRGVAERRDDETLFHHEWLQALARLCLHLRMRFVGTHDWYKEGAEMFLTRQLPTGQFGESTSEHCLAMLFLLRASMPSLTTAITPGDEIPVK